MDAFLSLTAKCNSGGSKGQGAFRENWGVEGKSLGSDQKTKGAH
jgi:hypothetical protein